MKDAQIAFTTVASPARQPLNKMAKPAFEILFEDTHLIVLSKPAGLLSQGEKTGDENLVDLLRAHFGRNYVGLIHRLDRNTSGIMIVAKRTKSAQRLTEDLQKGNVHRSYLAWIEGKLDAPKKWKHFLSKDENTNTVRVVSPGQKHAKEAALNVSPLLSDQNGGDLITLAEFVLETGRSHQIRVQAAHEKHALLGDVKYGGRKDFPRPLLHSYCLEFTHPMSKERMSLVAPLPEDFKNVSKSSLLDKALLQLALEKKAAT
jgi:23S rRNA pseudouridine1911/1915/1917 synthase